MAANGSASSGWSPSSPRAMSARSGYSLLGLSQGKRVRLGAGEEECLLLEAPDKETCGVSHRSGSGAMQTMTSAKEAAVSCGLSASGAAGGQARSVELFDGELAGDAITGDGEAAAEAGAELIRTHRRRALHGQVDGLLRRRGLRICTCFIMVFLYIN